MDKSLAARLEELTQAKTWLDAFRPLPVEITEELSQRFDVRLTYHSTAIEGNTLTQSETQIVLEKGVTIAGKSVREHLEAIGHKEAIDFIRVLAEGSEEIGERQIREIHSLVMKGQGHGDTGAYRTLDVKAAGTEFVYPSWITVPEQMRDFVQWLVVLGNEHPIERASEAHQRFVTIHPFRDGNGRVGRLLLNLLLLKSGYPIAVIPVERRAEYIDSLVKAQSGGSGSDLLWLVLDAVEASLRETLAVCLTAGDIKQLDDEVIRVAKAWLGG